MESSGRPRHTARGMSEENVELVRRALDAWNQQDEETALQLFSPDAELDASGRILNPDIYTGIDGLMRFRRDIAEAWDPLSWRSRTSSIPAASWWSLSARLAKGGPAGSRSIFARLGSSLCPIRKSRDFGCIGNGRKPWKPPACRSSWRPPLWTKSGYRRRRMSG